MMMCWRKLQVNEKKSFLFFKESEANVLVKTYGGIETVLGEYVDPEGIGNIQWINFFFLMRMEVEMEKFVSLS